MHHLRLLVIIVVVAEVGCESSGRDETASTSAYVISPPSSSPIGQTSSQIIGASPEAYWRLGEGLVLPGGGGDFTMIDSSGNNPGITGTYHDDDVELLQPGAIANDTDASVRFTGDGSFFNPFGGSYAHVDDHKVLSLTRTWDYFDQHGDTDMSGWGSNPSGEPWVVQVTHQDIYGIAFGDPDPDSVAYIDERHTSGSFQLGLPSTTLLAGDMQIRASWTEDPTSGILQPISLVAQQVDVHNHVRAELIEFADHSMEIDLIKVVNGQNTYLATHPLGVTHSSGDWWYLRFRFDGASYSARAWRKGDPEPTDWVTGSADIATTGSTAVRSANSNSNARPIVYVDDFWVQTIGFSVGFFIKIPDHDQPDDRVYALGKADSYGDYQGTYPSGSASQTSGPNGGQEYYFRVDGQNDLKSYVFNLEGGLGAGRGQVLDPNRWYYVVMELDSGDYLDPNAGLRLFVNGAESPTELYKGDGGCTTPCALSDGRHTTCKNSDGVDMQCWDITPLSGDAPFELGRGESGSFNPDVAYFSGWEDEVAVFGTHLACSDITNIFNTSCQAAQTPLPSGLYATASSYSAPYSPDLAVDGSPFTGWNASSSDPQSLTIDLGMARDISHVRLLWNSAYATAYQLQISTDGISWTTAATVTNGDGVYDDLQITQNARYLRLSLTASFDATGYSLLELEVYTCDIAPAACVNNFPIAMVGNQQLAFPGEAVRLDGTRSRDPEGGALTYSWSLSAPAGSAATIISGTSATTTFTPDVIGVYSATLIVQDDGTLGPYNVVFQDPACAGGACAAASFPATTVITVVPANMFVHTALVNDIALAQSLGSADITTAGNRNAFVNLLTEANAALQAGKIDIAEQKVSSAITRTDGWTLRGAPDAHEPGRDWIVGQSASTTLYQSLSLSLKALQTL